MSLSDDDRSGNEKRFRHASSDACSHLMLYLPAGVLNAKTIITAIGMIRYRMNNVVYVGRMNRVHFLLDGVFGGGPSIADGFADHVRDGPGVLGPHGHADAAPAVTSSVPSTLA